MRIRDGKIFERKKNMNVFKILHTFGISETRFLKTNKWKSRACEK